MYKCFYELDLKENQKFGISFINQHNFVNRATNYQALFIDYVKFKSILLIEDIYYDKIEVIFSNFIKNFNHGYRLNNIRKNCEIYKINKNDIMKVFYNYIKDNIKCKLLSIEEVNNLNNNYKNYLNNNNIDNNNIDNNKENENFKFRDYQQNDINKWNGETGILCYHTGLGKTITTLGMINKYFTTINKSSNNICFWITKKIDILKTQEKDFENMKKLFNFNIINNISGKNSNNIYYFIKKTQINIILINIDSLSKIENIITPDLCIFDECHSITADTIYNYLNKIKNNVPIIGLSATPIKLRNYNSSKRIKVIFNKNDNINFIGMITYIDAIEKNLVVPLRLKWINNIDNKGQLNEIENIEKLFNYSKKSINNILQKHNKIIFWTNKIIESKTLYKCLCNYYKNINIYLSNSKNDKKLNNIINFVNNKNKSILVCVNRFKEGSNDKKLSCGIYFTNIEKQEEHVFLQQIGRLTRIDENKDIAEFYQLLDNKNINEKEKYIFENIIKYIEYLSNNFNKLLIQQDGKKIIFKIKNTNKTFIEIDFNDNQDFNQININCLINKIKMYNKTINYDNFCDLLKTNKIRPETYEDFQKNNENLNLPINIYEKFPLFSWNIIYNNNDYYNKDEYLEILENFYNDDDIKNYIYDNMLDDNEILNEFIKRDKKIPNILPWLYYGQDINLIHYFNYNNYMY